MRFSTNSFALIFPLALACAPAASSPDEEGSGDGDGDTSVGDGDATGDGDGDAAGSGGSTTAGGNGAVGSGGEGSGGLDTGSGGAETSTGGQAASGGSAPVSCTPSSGTEDVGSDSFLDKATCLTWQKSDTHSGAINNRDALVHCSSLTQDGLTWRLPTAQELRSYPNLPDNGNAYLAGPTYIPNNAADVASGCTDNSHSCNLTQYSAGNFACAWQGPGAGGYPVLCVSGEAAPGTLDAAFEPTTCCSGTSTYTEADCSGF